MKSGPLFEDLVHILRSRGFSVGVEEQVRLHQLFDGLPHRFGPDRLMHLLGPVVAKSAEEQLRFHGLMDELFPMLEPESPIEHAPAVGEVPERESSGEALVRPRRKGEGRFQKLISRVLAVAAVVSIAAALFLVYAEVVRDRPAESDPSAGTWVGTEGPDAPPDVVPPDPETSVDSTLSPGTDVPGEGQPVAEPPERNGGSKGWAGVGVLLAAALGFWLMRRMLNVPTALAGGGAPFSWPNFIPVGRSALHDRDEVRATARELLRREASGRPTLDVGRSVSATVAAAGHPILRFRATVRRPEYLALIHRRGRRDHQAALHRALLKALGEEEVGYTAFFFDDDPRVCHPEGGGEPVGLGELQARYGGSRLLVLSDGAELLDPVTGQVEPWTEDLLAWEKRAILTPVPARAWGEREVVLSRMAVVVPASLEGARGVVDLFDPEATRRLSDWRSLLGQEVRLLGRREAEDPATLEEALGPGLFRWLCAVAVYPELEWDLTIHLGRLEEVGTNLMTAENLTRLLQVPWFREGRIPPALRIELIRRLDPRTESAVRREIVRLIEGNPAPDDSHAREEQRLQVALHTALGPSTDRRTRRRALRSLSQFPPELLAKDVATAALLRRGLQGPGALLTPGRLRKALRLVEPGASESPLPIRLVGEVTATATSTVRRLAHALSPGWRAIPRGLRPASFVGIGVVALAAMSWPLTRSFLANQRLDREVRAAMLGAQSVGSASLPVLTDLRALEELRVHADSLRAWERDGPPWRLRWGFYVGDDLWPEARQAYVEGFERVLGTHARAALRASLDATPSEPGGASGYEETYRTLKAYLILTDYPEHSTPEFLTPAVLDRWNVASFMEDFEAGSLLTGHLHFFAEIIVEEDRLAPSAELAVTRTRAFLRQFADLDRFYQSMITEADTEGEPVNFVADFPGAAAVLETGVVVPAAFTRPRRRFVLDMDVDEFFSSEDWVLGEAAVAPENRVALADSLRARYEREYVERWTDFLASTRVRTFASPADAARKLSLLSAATSPLLDLLAITSFHTDVEDRSLVRDAFRSVHSVLPPGLEDSYIGEHNQVYVDALRDLRGAMDQVAAADATTRRPPILSLAGQAANQAETAVSSLAQGFGIGPEGAPVRNALESLLLQPVRRAERVLLESMRLQPVRRAELNQNGQSFCRDYNRLLSGFPFQANARQPASVDDVIQALKPGESALSSFYDDVLSDLLAWQGSRYVARLGAEPLPRQAFVDFYNQATAVSRALFTETGEGPRVAFTIRPDIPEGYSAITVSVDGTSNTFTPTSQTAEPIVWQARRGEYARITGELDGATIPLVEASGSPWAIFELFQQAQWQSVSSNFYRVRWSLPAGGTLSALLGFPDTPNRVLDPSFLQSVFPCVQRITDEGSVSSAAPGFLEVLSNPWTYMWVDGVRQGGAGLQHELQVPSGVHRLRLENPNMVPVDTIVTVLPGDTTVLRVLLKERDGG